MQFGVNLLFCVGPNPSRSRNHCFIHFEASHGRKGTLHVTFLCELIDAPPLKGMEQNL